MLPWCRLLCSQPGLPHRPDSSMLGLPSLALVVGVAEPLGSRDGLWSPGNLTDKETSLRASRERYSLPLSIHPLWVLTGTPGRGPPWFLSF